MTNIHEKKKKGVNLCADLDSIISGWSMSEKCKSHKAAFFLMASMWMI